MPFTLDPQIAEGLEALNDRLGDVAPMNVGDVASRRTVYNELQRVIHALPPLPDDVAITDHKATTSDGTQLLLRWYAKENAQPGSAVVYVHGGGMCLSSVEIYDAPVVRLVSATGVPFLSVEYRYAPEFPAPTPVLDCYTGLQWLVEHAQELGVQSHRIAVMGDSGGGGIAASLAIYARDLAGPSIARQILVYPMLDDRNTTPDPELTPFAPWTYDDNITGWTALLGAAVGGPDVSPYGAAARLQDFSGLAPAYIDVGELDIFRAESVDYARNLLAAGVSTELHVYPGVAHAFDAFVPDATISRVAIANRTRAVRAI